MQAALDIDVDRKEYCTFYTLYSRSTPLYRMSSEPSLLG